MTTVAESSTPAPAAGRRAPDRHGRSRFTATLRLLTAFWLIGASVVAIAQPGQTSEMRGVPASVLLPLAGAYFTIGVFLLSGFMSRVAGLLLAATAGWEWSQVGLSIGPVVLVAIGVYLVLRGGGGWGMDVYVQKMQDRVRAREAREAAERQALEEAPHD